MARRWLVPLFLALVLTAPAAAQAPAAQYKDTVAHLERLIRHEMAAKDLPAASIALVDDQTVVWAAGFGFADAAKTKPATADTVYRCGSVSKLFTDLAVMQLVERGAIDLDAPVTKLLPDFKPTNPFDKPITLRQLMCHKSGLVRESPVGNYFDPNEPSLARTVESLNKTTLVHAPESKMKYSNAAIATVGLALEVSQREKFARLLNRTLLQPLGMTKTSFEPDPAVTKDLADAVMWTYHGREFPAPKFELGMAPAGCMYTTVGDLARFQTVLFAGGKTKDGRILKPETLDAMYKPQFAAPEAKTGFGIGFHVTELDGKRRIGHGGAIYGFSTEFAFLPEEKLGVVVVTSRDVCNAVMTHVADDALRCMAAAKAKKPLPKFDAAKPIPADVAKKLAGRYKAGDKGFDLIESDGVLMLWSLRGGFRVRLGLLDDDTLIVDDRLAYGAKLTRQGEKWKLGEDVYARVAVEKPKAVPAKWLGLVGEYGWDHNTLYILEKDGRLHALIEWVFLDPLEEESADVYTFPADRGLYPGEKLIFTRDKSGRATQVEAATVVFERRTLDGEGGKTFKIAPVKPVAELRPAAAKAAPPDEKGEFRKSELVDVTTLDKTIKLDLRYATDDNFLGTPLYPKSAKAYLQKPAAEALARVHKSLEKDGYGLLIHDAYRPWSVTKLFWDATPAKFRHFVADPSKGSRHNRGCAVDLTLFDRATGKPVEMVGGFDEFSDRAYALYPGGTSRQRWHRDLLRRAMEAEGFRVFDAEWWHFDYKDWASYRILNTPFEELGK